jgi:hypothetical protein
MNISDMSDDDMQKVFLTYCAKLMLQAKAQGHSMAAIEVDPKIIFGLPVDPAKADAGLLTIAVASGPSRGKLSKAIAMVQTEH